MSKIVLGLLVITVLCTPLTFGQKKVLSAEDYHRWSTLSNPCISDDGNWLAYDLKYNMAGKEDPDERKLLVKSIDGSKDKL